MGNLEEIFLNVFETSVNASIVIVLIILITKLFNNKISIRVKYTLWILAVIRLLIPVVPEMSIDINSIVNKVLEQRINAEEEYVVPDTINFNENGNQKVSNNFIVDNNKNSIQVQNYDSDRNITKTKINIMAIVKTAAAFVWSIGFLVLCSIFLFGLLRFQKRTVSLDQNKYKHISNLVYELVSKLKLHREIPVYISYDIKSPCIIGVVKPKIFIPEYILEMNDSNKLEHIFLHELMHYKRRDLYYNLFSIIAISLHWFNPLAWISIKKMRNYREYVCDASVLEFLGEDKNIEYGTTLIDCSIRGIERKNMNSFQLAICFEEKNQIKGRISMISKFKNGSIKMTKRGALACLVASAVVLSSSIVIFNKSEIKPSAAITSEESVIEANKIIVDSSEKVYFNINSAANFAGFDFKVPSYIVDDNYVDLIYVNNLSSDNKLVKIEYRTDNEAKLENKFSLYIFQGTNPEDTLKSIKNVNEDKIETKELNLGNIKGKEISYIETYEDGSISTQKVFMWEDNNIFYAIEYSDISIFTTGGESYTIKNLPENEVQKVAESLVEISNLDKEQYTTDVRGMHIYTAEDLKYATEKLGFEAKLFNDIDDKLVINYADVDEMHSEDSMTPSGNYILTANYTYNNKSIALYAEKINDKSSELESYVKYLVEAQGGTSYEKLEDTDVEAYKYEIGVEGKDESILNYVWNKDGGNYRIVIYGGKTDDLDENMAMKLINEK